MKKLRYLMYQLPIKNVRIMYYKCGKIQIEKICVWRLLSDMILGLVCVFITSRLNNYILPEIIFYNRDKDLWSVTLRTDSFWTMIELIIFRISKADEELYKLFKELPQNNKHTILSIDKCVIYRREYVKYHIMYWTWCFSYWPVY